MINSNQEEFLRMINDPAPQGQPDMADLAAQLSAAGGGGTLLLWVWRCTGSADASYALYLFSRVRAFCVCAHRDSLTSF